MSIRVERAKKLITKSLNDIKIQIANIERRIAELDDSNEYLVDSNEYGEIHTRVQNCKSKFNLIDDILLKDKLDCAGTLFWD